MPKATGATWENFGEFSIMWGSYGKCWAALGDNIRIIGRIHEYPKREYRSCLFKGNILSIFVINGIW